MTALVRLFIGFLLMTGVSRPSLADDLAEYFALKAATKDFPLLSKAGDLRLLVQTPLQLRFLEKRGLILVRLIKSSGSDDFFIKSGGAAKDAILFALDRNNIKTSEYPGGGFRIGMYPTAMVSLYCDIVAFQGRPYPQRNDGESLARLNAMMHMKLRAGDVVQVTLFGID